MSKRAPNKKNISYNPAAEIRSNSTGAVKKPRKIFYFVLILIPLLFFILLEAGLRIFDYGKDTTQWIPITDKKLMLNPDIAYRYFYNTDNIPYSNEELFDKVKSPGAFRIFVLGESSAAGYPYMPVGSFSRYLAKRLELLYPDRKIEVVNIAMTAINTYTLRDLFPGVLEQKPDLVLIYTGHNEFYGALGVGSVQSLGSSTGLVNTILYLNKFKTIELLRNTIVSVTGLFAGRKDEQSGTLMSRIVSDQYIEYGGDKYKSGLAQFRNNMEDILSMAKDNNVPVILGTLTSNLKDQPPFISIKKDNKPGASELYKQAKTELETGNKTKALEFFLKAKDNDNLRFRASEDINKIIKELGILYNDPVVKIDSVFNAVSPDGIVGNNLMTDHLHPDLTGFQLIAKLYFEQMKKSGYLPDGSSVILGDKETDSLTVSSYGFTRLDSTIADYRIRALKNDWPYIEKKDKKPEELIAQRKDFVDSAAFDVVFNSVSWEKVHRRTAQYYLDKKDYSQFSHYMDVLIEQYPVISEYYLFTANKFIELKEYDQAYKYLLRGYALNQDAYFSKWLGIIDLSNQKTDSAINYLTKSLERDGRDAQALFNLSGAYVYKNNYSRALELINRCLEVDPSFPEARELQAQLQSALSQK